ncbi:MAG: DNA primase [Akkermansiaceae bacterium]|nr:DNA primase [Akkermansiaceae bacterium]
MARITEECVARIKDSADIVDIVGGCIQLRRAGNSWKACCPFHNEKTPSFHVNPARQTFHCFGCGVGGDAIKFLMMFENLDYPTALRRVADKNGIAVVEEDENPELLQRRRLRGRIVEANQLAAEYFHRQLCRNKEADHVRAYLKQREFNIEVAKSWMLGWAPPDFRQLSQLAAEQRMDTRLLTDAYLLQNNSRGSYPVFRDRLMFPIHNVRGEIVGFSGRIMAEGQDPRKYVNTGDTVAFHKGELLFGLFKATSHIARAGMCVVICEGQLDVIACHEKADIRNAVAGLGTAFTDDHAATLRKYAKKAILCYDGDNAGIKASEKTFRKLAAVGMEVAMATLPGGEDPDSLIRTQGADALKAAIENARPYLEVRCEIEQRAAGHDANARAALVPRMADLTAEITDPIRRDILIADLAVRLNTGLEDLRSTVNDIIRNRKDTPPAPDYEEDYTEDEQETDTAPHEPAPARVTAVRLHPTIRNLICYAAQNKAAQQALVERIEELQDPINTLAGGLILQRLLEVLPVPGDAQAWQGFVAQLPAEQAAALRHINNTEIELQEADAFMEQACAHAARDAVSARMDTIKTAIRNGNLTQDAIAELFREMTELQRLLNGQ